MLFGKYVNKYYLKYLWCFLIGISVLVVVDIFHTVEPEQLGKVVTLLKELNSDPFNQSIVDEIKEAAIYIVVIGFLMFIGRIIWRYTLFFAATRIEADLRRLMFEKAERLSPHYYHKNSVGTILNWFTSDLEEILEYYKWGTIQIIDACFLSTFVLIKMFILSTPLTLIVLIPIALIAVWSFWTENMFTEKWKLRQESNDSIYDYAQESFTGIRVIKAFVKRRQQINAFSKLALKNKEVDVNVTRFFVIFERVIDLFVHLVLGAIIGIGGVLIYKAFIGEQIWNINLSEGDLVTFLGYFDTLLWPVMAIGFVISGHARANASLKRVTAFLDQEEEVKDCENPIELSDIKGKIEFRDLCFKYPSMKSNHLKNLSFVINPGENIGVIGRIGCGKTTISNLICRMYNPNPDQLFIDDVDIMKMSLKCLRSSIAYVPQDNFLFSDSVANNIKFGKVESTEEEMKKAADFSDVHNDVMEFPQQYETIIGERGATVSGGQKQRISLARAYIKDAPIMILDDSVSAVDVKTEEKILKNIRENRKGKTTIIVASRISTVAKLDKVLVLNNGSIEAFDKPSALIKTSPTYAKMFLLQKLEQEKEGGK